MKFSIVTPVYNLEGFIAKTIETVLSQAGDFDIEYIVMDDGSKDKSADVAQAYADKIADGSYPILCKSITMRVVRQENTGMYEAINRGFALATGDVFSWINADDLYQPGALAAVTKTLAAFPEIEWLKGITDEVDEAGTKTRSGQCYVYKQDWIAKGIYGQEAYFIQQDSVFWRKELWQKVAPMPAHYRSAADYWLWIQMAKYAPLWSLNVPVSCFRKREGQISGNVSKYKKEQWNARPRRSLTAWVARLFFSPQSRLIPHFQGFFKWLYPLLFMRRWHPQYIEITKAGAVKKSAPTYRV